MDRGEPKRDKSHVVLCADRFYMTDEANEILKKSGQIVWADCENEAALIKSVRNANPKVILSEYFNITERVMAASHFLKGVVVWGSGYDHVDVTAASEMGIYVANTRGSNAESVAEHTFMLLLNLSRRLLRADAFIRGGEWTTREEVGLPPELVEHDLYEKTLGIIGLGAVGSRVARIAKGFDMQVVAYDPYLSTEIARRRGAELVDLEKLLKQSDVVTVHVILTRETKNMIGAKELGLMKPSAYLVNVSRGPVVNESALIRALEDGKIAGAGLDVFAEEPIDLGSPLLKLDNVVITPHCAGNSREALRDTSLMVSKEATRILCDQIPKNLVNRPKLIEMGYLD